MQATPPDQATAYQQQIALLRNPKGLLRIIGWSALIHAITFVALGFLFWAMLLPLSLAFARLAFVWDAAYQLLGRMMGIGELPRLSRVPAWLRVYSAIWTIFQLALVGVLVWVLFAAGFCTQNLVCVAVRLLTK